MGPHPAVAAVRLAVRRALASPDAAGAADSGDPDPAGADVEHDRPVLLVACSGGADSLALLAATVFEGRRLGARVVGVTVDHGLQEASAEHADRVVAQMAGLGADETASVRVRVELGGRGVEAAAREARYAALEELAERMTASLVLLGHTLDDQAETVLLGLTRGSGGRSIAGMRPGFGPFRRPLLGITREQTEAACRAEGITWWSDPHNTDPRFTRARVRHRVLPVLESELGPGVAAALARTADGLQEDLAALEELADAALEESLVTRSPGEVVLGVAPLGRLPAAVRRRVLRRAAVAAGCPAAELFRVHVAAVDELVHSYRGQVRVELPGHVHATRAGGELAIVRVGPPPPADPVAG
jgi:tRNA(Ile)-lysidine synthase